MGALLTQQIISYNCRVLLNDAQRYGVAQLPQVTQNVGTVAQDSPLHHLGNRSHDRHMLAMDHMTGTWQQCGLVY